VVNFAQATAMFIPTSPGPCCSWPALLVTFAITVVIAFVERARDRAGVLVRWRARPLLTIGIVTLCRSCLSTRCGGLDLLVPPEAVSRARSRKAHPHRQIVCGAHDLGASGVTLVMLVVLFLFFRYTTLGLAMRAAPRPGSIAGSVGHPGELDARSVGPAAAFRAVSGIDGAPWSSSIEMSAASSSTLSGGDGGRLHEPARAVVEGSWSGHR